MEIRDLVRWDILRVVNKSGGKILDTKFLGRIMVRLGMKIPINMSLFTIHLIEERTIQLLGGYNIKERDGNVFL